MPNGIFDREGFYHNDLWHGRMVTRDNTGKVIDESDFVNGTGTYRIFTVDGMLGWEIPLREGKRHGSVRRRHCGKWTVEEWRDDVRIEDVKTVRDCERRPMKVMFMTVSPLSETAHELAGEIRELQEEFRRFQYPESCELIVQPAATMLDALHGINEHAPSVVHFGGRGWAESCLYHNDDGASNADVGRSLRELLEGRGVQLVVLGPCFSRARAEEIRDCAITVVVAPEKGDAEAWRLFDLAFYRSLGSGRSIGQAFGDGCDAASGRLADALVLGEADWRLVDPR